MIKQVEYPDGSEMLEKVHLEQLLKALQCVCAKCGYSWLRRTAKKPVACPQCKTRKWEEKT